MPDQELTQRQQRQEALAYAFNWCWRSALNYQRLGERAAAEARDESDGKRFRQELAAMYYEQARENCVALDKYRQLIDRATRLR